MLACCFSPAQSLALNCLLSRNKYNEVNLKLRAFSIFSEKLLLQMAMLFHSGYTSVCVFHNYVYILYSHLILEHQLVFREEY